MSALKLQLHTLRPTSANGALFPAACAAALALLAAAQVLLTGPEPLPETAVMGGGVRVAMPDVRPMPVDPVLRAAPLFQPMRTLGAAGGDGSVGSDGAQAPRPTWQIAGSISVRGRSYAIVIDPAGRSRQVPVGGSFGGMRLLALSSDGAVLRSGGRRVTMAYGASLAEGGPAADTSDTGDESE